MSDLQNHVLEFAKERWHSRTGLAVSLAFVAVGLTITFADINLSTVSLVEWLLIVAALLVLAVLWFMTRLPRVSKGKVGFGIAIEFEDSEPAKQVRSDFVVALRELVQNSPRFRHEFVVVEFSQSVAKVLTDQQRAERVARQSNLSFLLWGRARLRTFASGPSHLIDLHCLVRHGPIAAERSREFSEEFASILPRFIVQGGNVFAFEFAARHLDAAARFIIGTAAALSNDFRYAEELLLDAEARLQQYVGRAEGTPVAVLLDRVKRRIVDLYQEWLTCLARRHIATRDDAILQQHDEIAKKLQRYQPDNYSAHLAAAISAFALRGDIGAARREIAECRGSSDATWRYSEAFLYAYDGDLESAYGSYRAALQSPLDDPTVPTQCEEFIQGVIDREPHRQWLFYCLGLINHRAKGDLVAARADFQRFVDGVDPVRFARHVRIARDWIAEIDALIAAA